MFFGQQVAQYVLIIFEKLFFLRIFTLKKIYLVWSVSVRHLNTIRDYERKTKADLQFNLMYSLENNQLLHIGRDRWREREQ